MGVLDEIVKSGRLGPDRPEMEEGGLAQSMIDRDGPALAGPELANAGGGGIEAALPLTAGTKYSAR